MAGINMAGVTLPPISESMQTYLVTIARLRTNGQPVPLSQLARELGISPVSANEMCRKLQDQGLVDYQPYKGVSLTAEGERRALYILRRHRLWEVFLVEKLGFAFSEAHEAALQLELTTPDQVSDRLEVFLGHPTVNPEGQPIPRPDASLPDLSLLSLVHLCPGQGGHVVRLDLSEAASSFLREHAVRPGAALKVLAETGDAILVEVDGNEISLARALARAVHVEPQDINRESTARSWPQRHLEEEPHMKRRGEGRVMRLSLHQLKIGQRGVVVQVRGKGPTKQRMMDMGLVPGSEVKVLRVAPLGDPIEFEIKGYNLSLRRSEARDITVELVEESV